MRFEIQSQNAAENNWQEGSNYRFIRTFLIFYWYFSHTINIFETALAPFEMFPIRAPVHHEQEASLQEKCIIVSLVFDYNIWKITGVNFQEDFLKELQSSAKSELFSQHCHI